MPPRYATTSAYQAIFIVFLFPCTLSAPSGGSNDSADAGANAIVVVITVFSLVIVLSLGASLAYRFPSLLPTIFRRFRQAAAHMNHPFSAKLHHKLKARFIEIGRISNEAPTTPASPADPPLGHSPTQSTSVEVKSHEISSPLSILFENHSPPTSNQRSVSPESQAPDTPRTSTESIPREAERSVDAPNALAITRTENQAGFPLVANAAQLPSEMNRDDALPHDHLPMLEEETPLPQSPTPSTRPPTYYTDASRDSMYTLPLYQENEENHLRRTWSTRSRSSTTTRGHQNRSLPRPPLLPPPSSYPVKK